MPHRPRALITALAVLALACGGPESPGSAPVVDPAPAGTASDPSGAPGPRGDAGDMAPGTDEGLPPGDGSAAPGQPGAPPPGDGSGPPPGEGAGLPPGDPGGPPPGDGSALPGDGTAAAGSPAGGGGQNTPDETVDPFPRASLLAAAAPVVQAGAPVQPGGWVDGVEPAVRSNTCNIEDVDDLGEVLDAGRHRIEPSAGGFTLVARPDPEEAEDDEDDGDAEELDLGFDGPARFSCTIAEGGDTFACAAAEAQAPLTAGGAVTVRHTLSGTIADTRILRLEVQSQARCTDCVSAPTGLKLPCAVKLQRALVFEDKEGALGPVVEGRASGIAVPVPTTAPAQP